MSFQVLDYNIDDHLLRDVSSDGKARIDFQIPDKTSIVLGRGSSVDDELYTNSIILDEVPVYRRKGGGCSVVLDPGNLVISLVLPSQVQFRIKERFSIITKWMVDGFAKAGIDGIYTDGISDIVYNNRKIGGSTLHIPKGLTYYSISILVNAKLELIDHYLKHPPREPEYRTSRKHSDFITELSQFSNIKTASEMATIIKTALNINELQSIMVQGGL